MHQSLHASLDVHKRSVVRQAYDFPTQVRTHREALWNSHPRIRKQLLTPQRNTHLLFIKLQDLHLNFLARGNSFGGMRDSSPDEIADVQQPVKAAQIDEDSILRDVFHFTRRSEEHTSELQ